MSSPTVLPGLPGGTFLFFYFSTSRWLPGHTLWSASRVDSSYALVGFKGGSPVIRFGRLQGWTPPTRSSGSRVLPGGTSRNSPRFPTMYPTGSHRGMSPGYYQVLRARRVQGWTPPGHLPVFPQYDSQVCSGRYLPVLPTVTHRVPPGDASRSPPGIYHGYIPVASRSPPGLPQVPLRGRVAYVGASGRFREIPGDSGRLLGCFREIPGGYWVLPGGSGRFREIPGDSPGTRWGYWQVPVF